MQSGTRNASPWLAKPVVRNKINHHGSRSRIAAVIPAILADLLLFWDICGIFVCGVGSASLDSALSESYGALFLRIGFSNDDLLRTSLIGALLCPIVIRERVLRRPTAVATKALLGKLTILVAIVLTVAMATRLLAAVPSFWVAAWLGSAAATMLAGRVAMAGMLRWAAAHFGGERIAVVGSGADADWLRSSLRRARSSGIDLVRPLSRAANIDAIVADLIKRGRRGEIDRVVLALPGVANEQLPRIAHALKALRIEVASLYPMLGAGALQRTSVIANIPLFIVTRRPQWGYGGLSKQVMDRCLALALLLWMTPLLLLIALVVRLDSPGPVLFRQRRHGLNGTEFEIYKFRTMHWQGRGAGSGATQTGRRDCRVTRIGGFLRRSSLDEVPQLLNVLNGTMSVVGPRPHPTVMRTEERLGDEIVPEYPHRHRVKPGITGWAQVNGHRGATETADQLRQRIEHDNYYIENWSPWFDLQIIAMTPASLLLRRNNAF